MNEKHAPSGAISRFLPRHRKIWELEHRHHCSIVGTCLTLNELRRFCRKAGIKPPEPGGDYNLHIALVSMIGNNPSAARPVNKYLDRKYSSTIQHFARATTPEEQERLWRKAVSRGEIAGAYWALVTHPLATEQLLFQVYGDVHMLSHLSGASVRLDMQALHNLRRRIPELEHELAESRSELLRRVQEKDKIIQALGKRLTSLQETERMLADLQRRLQKVESGETLHQLHAQLAEQTSELDKMLMRAERAEAAAEKWRLLAKNPENLHHFRQHATTQFATARGTPEPASTRSLPSRISPCGDADCNGKNSDLCKRCVLYVGGRNRQRARFRTLVEQQNGYFIHHDGGLEESNHRLAELLPRADVVLCPLDCVSHDAVRRLVRHCRKHGKTLKLLPKSSLTAFAKGLNELFSNE